MRDRSNCPILLYNLKRAPTRGAPTTNSTLPVGVPLVGTLSQLNEKERGMRSIESLSGRIILLWLSCLIDTARWGRCRYKRRLADILGGIKRRGFTLWDLVAADVAAEVVEIRAIGL